MPLLSWLVLYNELVGASLQNPGGQQFEYPGKADAVEKPAFPEEVVALMHV